MYKHCNPNYVHEYTIPMISSRVIRLTTGCVSRCNEPEPCKEIPCDITIVPNPTTSTTSSSTSTSTSTSTTTSTTTIKYNYNAAGCERQDYFVIAYDGSGTLPEGTIVSNNTPECFYILGTTLATPDVGTVVNIYGVGNCTTCINEHTTTTTSSSSTSTSTTSTSSSSTSTTTSTTTIPPSTTTTTSSSTSTTTTTTTIPCINYGWDLTDVPPSTEVTLNYTDCYGNLMSTTLAAADFGQPFFYFCARIDTPSTPDTTGGFVNNGSCPCNPNFTKTNYSGVQYRNGDIIPEVTDPTVWASLTTGAWCHFNNDPANEAVYGKLYNWYAITDPRGFAPIGYHVPSDAEWICLINVWGGQFTAGGKLKEAGTVHWLAPNAGATNVSDFTALPGGYRFNNGSYLGLEGVGYYWTSEVTPKAYELSYINPYITGTSKYQNEGVSVRFIIE